jgi:hypothetical protein
VERVPLLIELLLEPVVPLLRAVPARQKDGEEERADDQPDDPGHDLEN